MPPLTRARAKQLQESFPKFMYMPKEVRLMVWKEILPDYGIYQVVLECKYADGNELTLTSLSMAHGSRCWPIIVGLALPPKEKRTPAFSARVLATRSLLTSCHESRIEVQRHFPHSVPSPGGELRFHKTKDIVCFAEKYVDVMGSITGTCVFTGGWNVLPRRLAVDFPSMAHILASLFPIPPSPPPMASIRKLSYVRLQAFQVFLSNFTNLQQLFVTNVEVISAKTWNNTSQRGRDRLAQALRECYSGGADTRHSLNDLSGSHMSDLTRSATNLDRIFHDDPKAQHNFPWNALIDFRRPQLQGVKVLSMVKVIPELEGLCKKIESE